MTKGLYPTQTNKSCVALMVEGPDDESDKRGNNLQRIEAEDQTTVTMSVTADVSDLGPKEVEMLQLLANQYESSFQEAVNKNRDYGMSFLRTGCKLAATDADPLGSPVRSQVYGLLTRTGDKRERLIENVFGDGDSTVSAPASETAAETANYYFFMSFVLANPELAQSFLDA